MGPEKKEILLDFFNSDTNVKSKTLSYSKYGYIFLITGALIAYLSFAGYTGNWFLLGLAFFILGFILIRKKLAGLFTFGDAEEQDENSVFEIFLSSIDEFVLKRALQMSGIPENTINDKTIYKIYVPVFEKISGVDIQKILRKQTEDETFIYSVWQIHILIAGKQFISYYSCVFNWLDNECINELTNEYYYSDIAAIKSETLETNFQYLNEDEEITESVKKIIISNVSGDKIEFIVQKPKLKLCRNFSFDADNFIKDVRCIVRKKRFPEETSYSSDDVDFEIEDKRT